MKIEEEGRGEDGPQFLILNCIIVVFCPLLTHQKNESGMNCKWFIWLSDL